MRREPEWWTRLAPEERPPLPLPAGIELGDRPGEYRNVKDGSVLLFVPAGTFTMGSDAIERTLDELRKAKRFLPQDSPPAGPEHRVTLSAYFIGKLEVTVEQFRRFVGASSPRHETEAERGGGNVYRSDGTGWNDGVVAGACYETPQGSSRERPNPREPVVQVTWDDASAYCAWAGLALPSDAQWERAALWDPKAGRARRYAWGDDLPQEAVANVRDATLLERAGERPDPELMLNFGRYRDGFVCRAPVGSFPLGKAPCGALDMTGNVAEWCRDRYDPSFYKDGPRQDPVCTSTTDLRIFRGGGWCDLTVWEIGVVRTKATRLYRSNNLGFRVARPAQP
jgi:formylglycine-generating enzyme required for sulfatase activity